MADQDQARQKRLSAALRENLKRRKAQTRGRAAEREPEPQSSAEPTLNDPVGTNPDRNTT
jgi:hypothetical protein